jgi:hypothetical protein
MKNLIKNKKDPSGKDRPDRYLWANIFQTHTTFMSP